MNALINWIAKNTPSCKEAVKLASYSMEHRLPLTRAIQLRLHMLICDLCKRYLLQLRFLRLAMRRYSRQLEDQASAATLSVEARSRIERALHS